LAELEELLECLRVDVVRDILEEILLGLADLGDAESTQQGRRKRRVDNHGKQHDASHMQEYQLSGAVHAH